MTVPIKHYCIPHAISQLMCSRPGVVTTYSDTNVADTITRASRLAKLEQAANRYLYDGGKPWHHNLRGTNFEFVSSLMDRPLTLVAVSCACLLAGNLDWIIPVLFSLLTVSPFLPKSSCPYWTKPTVALS